MSKEEPQGVLIDLIEIKYWKVRKYVYLIRSTYIIPAIYIDIHRYFVGWVDGSMDMYLDQLHIPTLHHMFLFSGLFLKINF